MLLNYTLIIYCALPDSHVFNKKNNNSVSCSWSHGKNLEALFFLLRVATLFLISYEFWNGFAFKPGDFDSKTFAIAFRFFFSFSFTSLFQKRVTKVFFPVFHHSLTMKLMTNVGIISFGTSKVRTCKHNMPRALEIVTAELSTTIQNPALKSLKRSYHHYHNTSGH